MLREVATAAWEPAGGATAAALAAVRGSSSRSSSVGVPQRVRVRLRASGVSWNDLLLGRAAVGASTDGDDDDAEGAQPQPVVALLRQQHPPRSSRAPLWPFLLVDRATDASRVALAASVVGAAAAVAWCRRRSSSSRCGVGGSSSEAGAPALDLVTTPSSRPRAAPREGTWTARLATTRAGARRRRTP